MEDDPRPTNRAEAFAKALGGTIGGTISPEGKWSCADCPDTGRESVGILASLALYRHRIENHVAKTDEQPSDSPHQP